MVIIHLSLPLYHLVSKERIHPAPLEGIPSGLTFRGSCLGGGHGGDGSNGAGPLQPSSQR